jgi:hypothetical protein
LETENELETALAWPVAVAAYEERAADEATTERAVPTLETIGSEASALTADAGALDDAEVPTPDAADDADTPDEVSTGELAVTEGTVDDALPLELLPLDDEELPEPSTVRLPE